KIQNNDSGDVALDHYHRYVEDVQLLKALGAKAYRFSISWPRIFPQGTGVANSKGLDFYNRLVDELLANGIQPFATLYHWDLPQSLHERVGGWESRDTSHAFANYAGHVAERLSDRVTHFFTINEFGAFVELGYRTGIHACAAEGDVAPARLRGGQRLPADVRPRGRVAARLRRRAASAIVPAHGVTLALHRSRGAVLGTAPRRADLERERDLRHRERM